MNNDITNEVSELSNTVSDTELPSMSLSGVEQVQDLNKETPQEEIQEEKTQGQYEHREQQLNKSIEKSQNEINELERIIETNSNNLRWIIQQANKHGFNINNIDRTKRTKENVIEEINRLIEEKNNQIITDRDEIYNLRNNDNYDRRTDSQYREDELRETQREREDTAYQRAVDDMRTAGLNPAGLSGVNYGGGGGGGSGSSKGEEEEEKRKRKKAEEEARQRAEEQRRKQEIMNMISMLGMFGSMGSMLGSAKIRGDSIVESANIRKQNTNSWVDSYVEPKKKQINKKLKKQ